MTAVAPTLLPMVLVRAFSGALHGLYIGLATSAAADLAAPERRGTAIALVFGGVAVATVVGAPVGRVLGVAFGWRVVFWVIGAAAAAAMLAVLRCVPRLVSASPAPGRAWRAAIRPAVVAFLGLVVLVMGGVFTFYTFVTAFLEERTGISGMWVSAMLLAFGLASAAGVMVGGRSADRSAAETMVIAAGGVTAALAALAVFGSTAVGSAVALVVLGLSAFAFVPAFQLRLMGLAGPAADPGATLGASAANAGIAIGAAVGGAVIASGITWLLVIACGVAAVGLVGSVLARRVDAP